MKKIFLRWHALWLTPLTLALICAGCIPPSHATFFNNTNRAINLEVSWPTGGSTYTEPVTLKPQQSRRTSVAFTEFLDVRTRSDHGALLLERRITFTREYLDVYASRGAGWEIYFLVTEDGVYPIPTQYRENWRYHLNAITSAENRRRL